MNEALRVIFVNVTQEPDRYTNRIKSEIFESQKL